jgi:hypothetical protein
MTNITATQNGATSTLQIKSSHSNSSSLDDLLSSSPEGSKESGRLKTNEVLTPKVITEEEIRKHREAEMKNSLKQSAAKDPYTDLDLLNRFVVEVEKFEKIVEGLTKETLSGPTPLDKEWKASKPCQPFFMISCKYTSTRSCKTFDI